MLIAAWYVWHSWPVAADVPARAESVSVRSTASPAPAEGDAPPPFPAAGGAVESPSTPTTQLVVHVAGSVAQPGIVTLPSGARVADAIQAVGGALPGTDTTGVNLARVLVDGEQVLVGVPAAIGAPVAGAGAPVPTQGAAGGPLDLNAATLDQLQNLPGLGPVLAQRIVDWRTAHGRFTNVDELQEVSGIGEQRLEDLRPLVRV
jgi:competence protein ComEA